MKVVTEAGQEVAAGTMVHMAKGPSIGQAWRFEKVVPKSDGVHHLHVSRSVPKLGRVHKEMHPHMFALAIVLDVKLYADRQRIKGWFKALATQAVLLTSGGIVAWIVAEYMQAHMG